MLAADVAHTQDLGVSLETERGILAKLKTAYLFNIAKFVSWPDASSTVQLCLRADSPVRRFASELDGRSLGDGRAIRLATLRDSAARCHIIFDDAPRPTPPNNEDWQFDGGVLTISDAPDAIDNGFAVQLFFESEKLRFAVDSETVKNANYVISSKLMRLARSPEGRPL